MEQVKLNLQNSASEEVAQSPKHTWFERWSINVCRRLVFNHLNKIEDAAIELFEQDKVECLGDKNAELKAVVVVNDPTTYIDFVKGGSIGAAKAYIDHRWSSPDLTLVIQVFARAQQQLDAIEDQSTWHSKLKNKLFHRGNKNNLNGSKSNILAHYDLGNDLYQNFLDSQMQYSSAIYAGPDATLEQAQNTKLETICQRLELTADDHLIEIGSGWGGLAIYAATHFGCKVTTTTISDAQYQYAKDKIERLGLSGQITLLKQDYRLLEGQYDKLVSIEMIEAVGHEYFSTFFDQCNKLVKSGGKMLIQAITIADDRYDYYRNNVDFIQRYIFPGGCLPSVEVLKTNIGQHTDMMVEQLHDIGLHYARTITDWREQFDQNWHQIKQQGFDDTFKRLWHYYLCYCEGAFLERATSTVHLVARK